jgi:hypothetical protein
VKKAEGRIRELKIFAEKGGTTKLKLPFSKWTQKHAGNVKLTRLGGEFAELSFKAGSSITLLNAE